MSPAKKHKNVAVVIISNGPGELETWVKPLVQYLRNTITKTLLHQNIHSSIRLCLVPCPNANGNELKVAKRWGIFDLITSAKSFWKLLLNPKLFDKWPDKGVVVFLGGDQFWSVLLSKRLGYENITYAEWVVRWPHWNVYIAAMNNKVKNDLAKRHKRKCFVIGDLMRDIDFDRNKFEDFRNQKWIAILPGSKKSKLSVGIPYFLEMADEIAKISNNINLMIPLAPTVDIQDLFYYASENNHIACHYSSQIKSIKKINDKNFDYLLETQKDTKIFILLNNPNYPILSQCELAVTTVGANTAELAAIQMPMIVVLPTQHLDIIKSWDGIFGILGKLPFFNYLITHFIKRWYIKNKKFFSWPNIRANKMVIPERIGEINPETIAEEVMHLINNEELLQEQKRRLSRQRGRKGAVKKLTSLILRSIEKQINYQGSSISNEFFD